MAVDVKYDPAQPGDWGSPSPAVAEGYTTESLALADGTHLFVRCWAAPTPTAPVLVLTHGLGAHSGWFIDMANALNARGLAIYAMDQRGFGRSEGPRGHVDNGQTYIRDLQAVLRWVSEREPGRPLYLLGHSMGGIFTLHVAAEDAQRATPLLAGIVLLNPWIDDQSQVKPTTVLGVTIGGMLKSRRPVSVSNGSDAMTVNPEATRMLTEDPYWVRAETQSFLLQITLLRRAAVRKAMAVRAPALVIQAENDKSVVAAASERAYEALGSADKTYVPLPGYEHDSELQKDRAALDDLLTTWMLQRTSAAGGKA